MTVSAAPNYWPFSFNGNTSAHKVTVSVLTEQSSQVLAHLWNRPNLTLCDFWLSPLIKETLAGWKCSCIQDLAKVKIQTQKFKKNANLIWQYTVHIFQLSPFLKRQNNF